MKKSTVTPSWLRGFNCEVTDIDIKKVRQIMLSDHPQNCDEASMAVFVYENGEIRCCYYITISIVGPGIFL